jgi:hypothetical protein
MKSPDQACDLWVFEGKTLGEFVPFTPRQILKGSTETAGLNRKHDAIKLISMSKGPLRARR